MATKKYLSLERLTEYDGLIKAEIAEGDAGVKTYVNTELAKKADATHTHDDRYYTESEIDTKLSGKSDTGHKHEISDINELLDVLNNKAVANHKHSFDDIIEGTLSIAKGGTGATTEANARTNLDVYSKSEVDTKLDGLDYYKTFYFQNATSTYAGAPSDGNGDTPGFEAEGKDAICFVASDGRINFSLEPNSYGADDVIITVNADPEGSADAALEEAKSYADDAANKVKNDLLNGAGEAYDTLKELGDLITENVDAIEALETVATNKADKEHIHSWNELEDKPFGEEIGEFVSVTQMAPAMNTGTLAGLQIPVQSCKFTVGDNYTITLNDTVYNSVAATIDEVIYIGNLLLYAQLTGIPEEDWAEYGIVDTGEPYFILSSSEDSLTVVTNIMASAYDLKITGIIIRKIDDAYVNLIGKMGEGLCSEIFNDYDKNIASGDYSHAEGNNVTASGDYSHAEGMNSKAIGYSSHAEGSNAIASGESSHAEGYHTIAAGEHQHVQGVYNIEDTQNKYAHIIGNGDSTSARSNAHTLDWDGNAWYAGKVLAGGTSMDDAVDLAKPDWSNVQNKPFYETVNELYNNTSFVSVSEDGWRFNAYDINFILEDGKQYKVVYGDNSYIYTAKVGTFGDVFIGNGSYGFHRNGEDNGEPVYIYNYPTDNPYKVMFYTKDYATSLAVYEYDFKYLESKYIKDMYYESEPVLTTLLEETNVEIGEDLYSQLPLSLYAEIGKTYYITFNGVNYECVAWNNGDSANIIGNGSIYGGEGQGEDVPFAIETYEDNSCYLNTSVTGTYTVSISGTQSIIYKIDEKYLPDKVANSAGMSTAGMIFTLSDGSTVTGNYDDEIFNDYASNKAYGGTSHAEGYDTEAGGFTSHAEGYKTKALSQQAHAEGAGTTASGKVSHAEGQETTATGDYSHAEGYQTTASSQYQHVQGKYNVIDTVNKYAHIIGNGTSNYARLNAHTVDWNGNAWYAGDVYVGGTSQDDGKQLATKEYVDTMLGDIEALLAAI